MPMNRIGNNVQWCTENDQARVKGMYIFTLLGAKHKPSFLGHSERIRLCSITLITFFTDNFFLLFKCWENNPIIII